MASALIGYTGFVGGNLRQQFEFDDLYNSSNIEQITGQSYDVIVCAGAPGVKWKANKEPDKDWASIQRLMSNLTKTRADHIILISTVDVYPSPGDVDEDTPIDESVGHAYGRHRLLLEKFVQERFEATIIRLPGLFGNGLKKNVIYDFLHNNALDLVCPGSVYQFYNLNRLWADIATANRNRVQLINFATEGLSVKEIAREAFGYNFTNPTQTNAVLYDFKTKYDNIYGGDRGYIYRKVQVMSDIRAYVKGMKAKLKGRTGV
jgi:nucleoside-diphosphate-sugar epimerase